MRTARSALGLLLAVAIGCGNEPSGQTPDAGLSPDAKPTTQKSDPDQGVAKQPDKAVPQETCGPKSYPCGPYGVQVGDVVENLKFKAFADPDFLCKEAKAQQLDMTSPREISFQDYFKGSASCEKKKLLWVMVSAGWCGPCILEVGDTQKQFKMGAIDKRVALINVLFETDKHQPTTESFLRLWTNNTTFQLSFTAAMDDKYTMTRYFEKSAVPYNMLIDLSTMKIIHRHTGANLPALGAAMNAFLNK